MPLSFDRRSFLFFFGLGILRLWGPPRCHETLYISQIENFRNKVTLQHRAFSACLKHE